MQIKTVAEQLFFTTIRIETESAQERGSGTGFFFTYTERDKQHPFMVSNKHVIRAAQRGTLLFTERDGDQPKLGGKFAVRVDNFADRWFGLPDHQIDVAVMPLAPILGELPAAGRQVFFKTISQDLIPSLERLGGIDAIEEVIFTGYPNGIYDRANLLPAARRGITATPISVDYEGKKQFLIDGSVFPGSSGSPVFILNVGSYSNRKGITLGSRLLFVGVLASVFTQPDVGEIDLVDIPTAKVPFVRTRHFIDLGVVFKAATVVETIKGFLAQHTSTGGSP